MKEKLKSRKFWIAVLTDIVSITVVFTKLGGTAGTVAGIIGTLSASISYMITECRVDVARAVTTYEEIKMDLEKLKSKKEGE